MDLVQLEVAKGNIKLEKVPGDVSPAYVLTKYKSGDDIERLLIRMGVETIRGDCIVD